MDTIRIHIWSSNPAWPKGTTEGCIYMSNDGSAYESRDPRYDGKTDHFFNESGTHDDPHGHVVEGRDTTPEETTYDYARDVDGNVYVDTSSSDGPTSRELDEIRRAERRRNGRGGGRRGGRRGGPSWRY